MSHGVAIPSFGDLPQDQQDEILQECQSQECLEATDALTRARNDLVEKCDNLKYLDSQVVRRWVIVAGLAAAAAALAAAGGALISIPEPTGLTKLVGVVLVVVAGILAIIAAWLTVLAIYTMLQAAEARRNLQESRDAFHEAVANLQAACGIYCRPDDLAMPPCT